MAINKLIGQNITKPSPSYSVFLETPWFYKDWYGHTDVNVYTLNMGYMRPLKKGNYYLGFNLGYGIETRRGYKGYDPVVFSEINFIAGKKTHFMELGLGPNYAGGTVMLKCRLGYRLHLGRRFLLRIAYTPGIFLKQHIDTELYPPITGFNALSLSLGYRFASKKDSRKDGFFKLNLASLQLNFHPLYYDFRHGFGFMRSFNMELNLLDNKKARLFLTPGFTMSTMYDGPNAVRYMPSFAFNILINNRRIESGISITGPTNWDDYRCYVLQASAGYRFYTKGRIFFRALYSPYLWLSEKSANKLVKKRFVHDITLGIGWTVRKNQ